jgi:hypothetical protein
MKIPKILDKSIKGDRNELGEGEKESQRMEKTI